MPNQKGTILVSKTARSLVKVEAILIVSLGLEYKKTEGKSQSVFNQRSPHEKCLKKMFALPVSLLVTYICFISV